MRRANSRAALFLGEVVLALLIFALSSAVCIGLLFRAYRISEASSELNQAVFCAQSAAETFKADAGFRDLLMQSSPGSYDTYYDESWQPADKQNAVYIRSVALRAETGPLLLFADISVKKGLAEIYAVSTAAHVKFADVLEDG